MTNIALIFALILPCKVLYIAIIIMNVYKSSLESILWLYNFHENIFLVQYVIWWITVFCMWFSCGVHNLTIKAYISINTQLVATSAHVKTLNGFSLNHTQLLWKYYYTRKVWILRTNVIYNKLSYQIITNLTTIWK